jgi:DNA-binding transcriptional MerR regulator
MHMHGEELLGIGAFGLLTGLTVTALRHYDEVDLLRPAAVDPASRYRYYRRSQVAAATLVRDLRAIDLPLEEVRIVLADASSLPNILATHRARLETRLAALDDYLEKGAPMPTTTANRIVMLNLAAPDLAASKTFYEALLELEFAEEHHGDGPPHLNATFGEWGTPSWFLLSLWPKKGERSDVGFLVADVDEAHRQALAHGGTDVHGPRETPGMPRHAQVRDPAGNHVGLYQA